MPVITLPSDGEKPYGNELRAAINAINDAVDATIAGLPDTVNATIETGLTPEAAQAIADRPEVDTAVAALLSDPDSYSGASVNSVVAAAPIRGQVPFATDAAVTAPSDVSFRLARATREFYTLRLPLYDLDLRFDPSATGGLALAYTTVTGLGMNRAWSSGAITYTQPDTTTTHETFTEMCALDPFGVYELDIANLAYTSYGVLGIEVRSTDGRRIVTTYRAHEDRISSEYLNASGTPVGPSGDWAFASDPTSFTMRVQFMGRSLIVWMVVNGVETYLGRKYFGAEVDLRDPAQKWVIGVNGRSSFNPMTFKVTGFRGYISGNGHADPRIVTYEDGTPVQEADTVWVAMTTRGSDIPDAIQGVYSLNVSTGEMQMTGAIFGDRGDGIRRNDNAGKVIYDRRDRTWKLLFIGHSDYPTNKSNYFGQTGQDLRYGVHVLPVSAITTPDATRLFEDMDVALSGGRWIGTASRDASVSVKMQTNLGGTIAGPWFQIASDGSGETGNTLTNVGGEWFVLSGTTTAVGDPSQFVVRDYATFAIQSPLVMDRTPRANRVWPVMFPVVVSGNRRWRMLSFDRTAPAGAYSYGRILFYKD